MQWLRAASRQWLLTEYAVPVVTCVQWPVVANAPTLPTLARTLIRFTRAVDAQQLLDQPVDEAALLDPDPHLSTAEVELPHAEVPHEQVPH